MSRKDYIAIAAALAAARREADEDGEAGYNAHVILDGLTYDLADILHRDNPRFDSRRFFVAADMRDVRGKVA